MSTIVDLRPGYMGVDEPTQAIPKVKRARVRGLRMPSVKVPSWPLLAQVGGAFATLGGVYLEWGTGVTMIVGGLAAVVVGALREAGKV